MKDKGDKRQSSLWWWIMFAPVFWCSHFSWGKVQCCSCLRTSTALLALKITYTVCVTATVQCSGLSIDWLQRNKVHRKSLRSTMHCGQRYVYVQIHTCRLYSADRATHNMYTRHTDSYTCPHRDTNSSILVLTCPRDLQASRMSPPEDGTCASPRGTLLNTKNNCAKIQTSYALAETLCPPTSHDKPEAVSLLV